MESLILLITGIFIWLLVWFEFRQTLHDSITVLCISVLIFLVMVIVPYQLNVTVLDLIPIFIGVIFVKIISTVLNSLLKKDKDEHQSIFKSVFIHLVTIIIILIINNSFFHQADYTILLTSLGVVFGKQLFEILKNEHEITNLVSVFPTNKSFSSIVFGSIFGLFTLEWYYFFLLYNKGSDLEWLREKILIYRLDNINQIKYYLINCFNLGFGED